jgi:cation diffusion facilitator CzcD-associated flavoprotein CzcO
LIRRVAVIGAGAAGLVATRELVRAGFEVDAFERGTEVGGIWVYSAETERDPLGQRTPRIHSSLYASLRTNLPRDLMAYTDYPFDSAGGGRDEWPRFPGHACVREYLERFARDFGITERVRFAHDVTVLEPDGATGWALTANGTTLRYDAVAVCSGHYATPRLPEIAGADAFPARQMHSHNYREQSSFRGRCVALLGTAASGTDLAREIATVAERVYWCGDLFAGLPAAARAVGRLHRLPGIARLRADGRIEVHDGGVTERVDDLVYCTGYRYEYPFLDARVLPIEDNHVQGLYRDFLLVERPTLAVIGVPYRVVPFPLFELQARCFARVLAGTARLPTRTAMRAEIDAHAAALRAAGVKSRHVHQRNIDCYDYLDALADEAGVARPPDWQRCLAAAFLAHMARHGGDARDRPFPHFGPTRVPAESVAPTEEVSP